MVTVLQLYTKFVDENKFILCKHPKDNIKFNPLIFNNILFLSLVLQRY